MIKCDKGKVEICGTVQNVFAELSTLVHFLHHHAIVQFADGDYEESRKMILEAVERGLMSKEEAKDDAKEAKALVAEALEALAKALAGKDEE